MSKAVIILQVRDETTNHIKSSFRYTYKHPAQALDTLKLVHPLLMTHCETFTPEQLEFEFSVCGIPIQRK